MDRAPAVELFLGHYVLEPGQALTPAEHALLHEALTDFLVHEQWVAPTTPDQIIAAKLKALADDLVLRLMPDATDTLRAAAVTITDLAARLARSDHVNLVLREQLAIRSDPRSRGDEHPPP